jgi:hypothetical protein
VKNILLQFVGGPTSIMLTGLMQLFAQTLQNGKKSGIGVLIEQ